LSRWEIFNISVNSRHIVLLTLPGNQEWNIVEDHTLATLSGAFNNLFRAARGTLFRLRRGFRIVVAIITPPKAIHWATDINYSSPVYNVIESIQRERLSWRMLNCIT